MERIKIRLERPLPVRTRHFETVVDKYLTFDTEYEYFIQKWDILQDEVYKQTISKKQYDECEYPEADIAGSDEEFTKDFVQYTVIKTEKFNIKIKLTRFEDAEWLAEKIAEDVAEFPNYPEDEYPIVLELNSYLDSLNNNDIIVID